MTINVDNLSFLGIKKIKKYENFVFGIWNDLKKMNPGEKLIITDEDFICYKGKYYFVYGSPSVKRQYLNTIFSIIGRMNKKLSFMTSTSYGNVVIRRLSYFEEDLYCTDKRVEERGLTSAYNDPINELQIDRILKRLKELGENLEEYERINKNEDENIVE